MLVGQAPGVEEDAAGECFVGPAGQLLVDGLAEYGVEDYYLTNVVRCYPPGDRAPKAGEVKACAPHIEREIEAIQPRVIVPVGAVALKALTGLSKVTSWAGIPVEHEGRIYLPIIHPAAPLHNEALLPAFEASLRSLAAFVGAVARRDESCRTGPDVHYRTIKDDRALRRVLDEAETARVLAFDFETTSIDPRDGKLICMSLCWEPGEAYCVFPTARGWARVAEFLGKHGATERVCHQAPFEIAWSRHHLGVEPWNVAWDTAVMDHLVNEDGWHELWVMAWAYTAIGGYDNEMRRWKAAGNAIHDAPEDDLAFYSAGDADATLRCYPVLLEKLKREKLLKFYNRYERGVWYAIARMENDGIAVDLSRAGAMLKRAEGIKASQEAALSKAPQVAAMEAERCTRLNYRSHAQVSELLYQRCDLEVIGRTAKTRSPSTKADYIEILAKRHPDHPVLAPLLEWKDADGDRLFLKQIEDAARREPDGTHIVSASFNQAFVVTGRLSCTGPNLQALKKTGPLRSVFVSRFHDGVLIAGDWRQMQLRLIGGAAGEERILDAAENEEDLHAITALELFSVTPKTMTAKQRDIGKHCNYAFTFDVGERTLANQIGCDVRDARRFIRRWHKAYPALVVWGEKQRAFARRHGYIRSPLGRVRHLPGAMSDDEETRHRALRQAKNYPIQEMDADVTKWCFRRVSDVLEAMGAGGYKAREVLQVHDNLVIDTPGRDTSAMKDVLKRVMEHEAPVLHDFGVNLSIDLTVNRSLMQPSARRVRLSGRDARS